MHGKCKWYLVPSVVSRISVVPQDCPYSVMQLPCRSLKLSPVDDRCLTKIPPQLQMAFWLPHFPHLVALLMRMLTLMYVLKEKYNITCGPYLFFFYFYFTFLNSITEIRARFLIILEGSTGFSAVFVKIHQSLYKFIFVPCFSDLRFPRKPLWGQQKHHPWLKLELFHQQQLPTV